jgi:hypothetical protein
MIINAILVEAAGVEPASENVTGCLYVFRKIKTLFQLRANRNGVDGKLN